MVRKTLILSLPSQEIFMVFTNVSTHDSTSRVRTGQYWFPTPSGTTDGGGSGQSYLRNQGEGGVGVRGGGRKRN